MKYIKAVFICAVFLVCSNSFAQDSTEITKNEYNNQLDSLQGLKQKLLSQKESLISNLENMEQKRDSLRSAYKEEQLSFYILKYGKENGERVYNKRVWTGMTREMLRDSWGKPDSMNINKKDWGTYSQWYYGEVTFFFKNGKLFEWEGEER